MKEPLTATKKAFRIFLAAAGGALAVLLVPLYIFGGALPLPIPRHPAPRPASAAQPASSPAIAIPEKPSTPGESSLAPAPAPAAVYTVSEYEPSRDPAADLAETVKRAQAENKRILVLVGGSWCLWSRALDVFILENEKTAAALGRDFLIMKVNLSRANANRIFVERFEEISAIPHFFVLDSNGELLHSQPTEPLEKGPAYDSAAFLEFLAQWAPPPEAGGASE